MGNPALFFGPARRKGAPRWRGPARQSQESFILMRPESNRSHRVEFQSQETGVKFHIDEAGVRFQSQTLEVAQYCARENVEAKDMGEVGRSPATGPPDPWDAVSTEDIEGVIPRGERRARRGQLYPSMR